MGSRTLRTEIGRGAHWITIVVRLQADVSAANLTPSFAGRTSDVVNTSAPQTSGSVDTGIALRQDCERQGVTLHRDERRQRARARQFALPRWRDPDNTRMPEDRARTTSAPTGARSAGDRRVPVIGDEVAEHTRGIGNREPRARMPHRRPDENLRVDEDRGRRRQPAEQCIVDAARVLVGNSIDVPRSLSRGRTGPPPRRCEHRDRTSAEENSASPACAVDTAAGREKEDGDAAEDARAITVASAVTPNQRSNRAGRPATA